MEELVGVVVGVIGGGWGMSWVGLDFGLAKIIFEKCV